ncbi:hypothetical protein A5731_26320 [Mycolicibacterium conceptionense]|jgi:hypothetical protein|uniref:DUF2628 domain-containing protein n=2 Tax=Mycolicibacterium TaxID=1866885 RepID=A0A0J8UG85_9MYCO|nr:MULTISPECIES: DUF2628 domain-containing protein [Mycolicibacterium]KLI07799.1 hypothetical protein AA982_11750 [Mycolicibacterium senegalense]KLO48339.1 hypothetical protein ABW05_26985 [Mycolicibacterium senegalense]KMV20503.1 hypothetical protein ACT17_02215 [Mycolicibacterium conceptionense]MCW1821168.1 DUF2628 domain-containing protein [Mycolicibacterium senegalense]OBB08002.1 hypothetical protein A5718_14990 [Mycolicibacterium conceptionense]
MTEQTPVDNLSDSWRWKFDFFHTYGLPASTPAAKAAYRDLSFMAKLRLTSNVLAFLFGPIYFFVKGMWRKGLSLLGIAIAAGVVLTVLDVSDMIGRSAGIAIGVLAMSTANYAYYLHVVRGSRSWNPFEGFGRAR